MWVGVPSRNFHIFEEKYYGIFYLFIYFLNGVKMKN